MKRSRARLRLSSCLVAGILAFIWGNSLLPAELSQAFSDWVKALLPAFPTGGEAAGSGLLRKMAHFAEFAALGMSLGWLLGMLGRPWQLALLLGCGAACVDESIQLLVPGRGPALSDVALDTAGVAVGLAALCLGHFIVKKSNKKYLLEETKQ